jgi:hypothetical protein
VEVELKLTCEAVSTIGVTSGGYIKNIVAAEDATEEDTKKIIGGGLFGRYAALEGEEGNFLEVGFKGRPASWAFDYEPGTWERDFAEGCRAFTERTGSERWSLDYFDAATGENYEVNGDRTLSEVTRAFIEYLRGDDAWRTRHTWTLARLNRGRLPEIPH